MTGEKSDTPREVLFEMLAIGHLVKVVAVDARTGLEVTIQGPASAGQAALKQAALRKLKYVLAKRGKA